MARVNPSEVGFCIVNGNAGFIADALSGRVREALTDVESNANRLYRGRHAYSLNQRNLTDLRDAKSAALRLVQTIDDILQAQCLPEAAE